MRNLMANSRGFALVLVLSLLAILVLVTYAISTVGKVSGAISSAAVYQIQARQNALAGLKIAIGELQSAAGGDVVTASASIRGTSVKYPSLLGVWPSGSASVLPPNWIVSGNFESSGTNQITYGILPIDPPAVTLVGSETVTATADMVRVSRVWFPGENGGYAFWVGDEGNKPSLGFDSSEVLMASNGVPYLPDPRGEIPAFEFSNLKRGQVLIWDQIRDIAPGASLKSRFHSYASRSFWLMGTGNLQGGLFNINTTDADAWAAVLRIYDAARASGQPALESFPNGGQVGVLASRLVGKFSQRSSLAKVRSGPFRSVAGFWDSNIVQDSLDDAGITLVTQDDLREVLDPILAVRSDTFRIRAYGDAMNPADADDPNAKPEAVAYCEAIVQRTNQDDPGGHGKKFVVTYFRWLGPDDI